MDLDGLARFRQLVVGQWHLDGRVWLAGYFAPQTQVVAKVHDIGYLGFKGVGAGLGCDLQPLRANAALHGVTHLGGVDIKAP